jgi:hypothetical protein
MADKKKKLTATFGEKALGEIQSARVDGPTVTLRKRDQSPDDPHLPQIKVAYDLIDETGQRFNIQPIGDDRALPSVYTATVDDPTMPFLTRLTVHVVNREASLDTVVLKRRDTDPSITARSLRGVPIARYLEASVIAAEMRVEKDEHGASRIRPLHADEYTAREYAAAGVAARRRKRTTDPKEHDDEVNGAAALYREALADEEERRRPTIYVSKAMHVSRAKAARLLAEARQAGLLAEED